MKKYPLDLNGKPTTKEQWDQYEIDLKHFEWRVKADRDFADHCFQFAKDYGIDKAKEMIYKALDEHLSMDAPNKPGYYRANND